VNVVTCNRHNTKNDGRVSFSNNASIIASNYEFSCSVQQFSLKDSLLQAGINPFMRWEVSDTGPLYFVYLSRSFGLPFASVSVLMSSFTALIHLFRWCHWLRCPCTSASMMRLMEVRSSLLITCSAWLRYNFVSNVPLICAICHQCCYTLNNDMDDHFSLTVSSQAPVYKLVVIYDDHLKPLLQFPVK